jgi:hypothetical protein
MRAFFGTAKAAGFVFLASLWATQIPHEGTLVVDNLFESVVFRGIGWTLVWSSVVLTVVRAIPVIIDSVAYLRDKNGTPQVA